MQVHVSEFAAADRPGVTGHADLTWDQLTAMLSTHTVADTKKAVRMFNFCRFSTPYRADANVVDVSALMLDVDKKPLAEVQAIATKLAPFRYIAYSTHTHGVYPDLLSLRIVVALSRPVQKAEWPTFSAGVQAWLGSVDRVAVTIPSQAYYLPSRHPDRQALTSAQPGAPLDVHQLLADTPPVNAPSSPVADVWRPERVVGLEELRRLPGAVPARLLAGEKLAPSGERHETRRNLVYQFLVEYGPCEPDSQLLHLLVSSADADASVWVRAFQSSSARAKAEAQHLANKAEAEATAAVQGAVMAAVTQASAEAQQRLQAASRAVQQAQSEVFTSAEVKELAKKAKDPTIRKVLTDVFRGGGLDPDYKGSAAAAGAWLAKKSGKDPGVIKRALTGLAPDDQAALWQGVDLGAAQIRNREAWRQGLHMGGEDKASASEPNVRRILRMHPDMQGVLAWDSRQHTIRLLLTPPWERTSTDPFIGEADRGAIGEWIASEAGIAVTTKTVGTALASLQPELPVYDPIAAWLNGLAWDGSPRLDRWLVDYCGARDSQYVRRAGACTLLAAVARAFKPGCKVDTVLVLEGAQGAKKSSIVRALAPIPSYFRGVDGVLRGDNKDLVMQIVAGAWVIELEEVDGVSRSDAARTKAFLSRQEDVYRPPYAATIQTFPRVTTFIATTNACDYLADPTGARRWWPVQVTACTPERLELDRAQLWAEAAHRFKQGEPWWINASDPVYVEVLQAQAGSTHHDVLEGDVLGFCEGRDVVSYKQLAALIGADLAKDRGLPYRMAAILRRAGWVQGERQRLTVDVPFGQGIDAVRPMLVNDRFWRKVT